LLRRLRIRPRQRAAHPPQTPRHTRHGFSNTRPHHPHRRGGRPRRSRSARTLPRLYSNFPRNRPRQLGQTAHRANRLHLTANPPVFRTTFLTAPGFVSPDDSEIEITVTAKRIPSESGQENPTGLNLTYESTYGTNSPNIWWSVPGDNKWHTHTWTLTDAKFTGKLGWNFLLDASGSGNDVLIKEVSVKR
jgi:hypothetical protein